MTNHILIVTTIFAQSDPPEPTGIGLVMLVGFLAGSMVGLLASILLRAFGAPVEAVTTDLFKE